MKLIHFINIFEERNLTIKKNIYILSYILPLFFFSFFLMLEVNMILFLFLQNVNNNKTIIKIIKYSIRILIFYSFEDSF